MFCKINQENKRRHKWETMVVKMAKEKWYSHQKEMWDEGMKYCLSACWEDRFSAEGKIKERRERGQILEQCPWVRSQE